MRQSASQHSIRVKPKWVLFLGGLSLVLLLAGLCQKSSSEFCVGGGHELCPDLLGATIRIKRYALPSMVAHICGDRRSNACAIRKARWQRVTCEVHVLTPEAPGVLQHELNHCRGWEHQGDSQEAYGQPWVPNWRLVHARGGID
ncbi:MAG: hypothetical protein P8O91_03135 [Luminiphilus sp.]|nr:hypothetical protein [Luminiphilus sp.]